MTYSIQNKTQEVVGVLFGILLFYFWLIFIDKIKMLLFSETIIVNGNKIIKAQYWGQIDQWLVAGLILFFLVFGHYLIYSKNINGIEKKSRYYRYEKRINRLCSVAFYNYNNFLI
jgi:hypothetical protein